MSNKTTAEWLEDLDTRLRHTERRMDALAHDCRESHGEVARIVARVRREERHDATPRRLDTKRPVRVPTYDYKPDEIPASLGSMGCQHLGLNYGVLCSLRANGVRTIDDLAAIPPRELLQIPGIGPAYREQIVRQLNAAVRLSRQLIEVLANWNQLDEETTP